MIDTHIHLSHKKFNQMFPYLSVHRGSICLQNGTRKELIQSFVEAGISACVEPAIEIDSISRLLALAQEYPGYVFPAVGVHPTRTFKYQTVDKQSGDTEKRLHWNQRRLIEQYAQHPQVVAIGETGLDYHLARKDQHRVRQVAWFVWQIRLAHKKNLPLILHIREADQDALRILRLFRKWLHGGVCHCFSGSAEQAKQYTELGFMIGVGGMLLTGTKRKMALERAVVYTPLESILLETDGPYVKPYCAELSRKQVETARNTSLILPAVAARIAELKQLSIEEVETVTTMNAEDTFSISLNHR